MHVALFIGREEFDSTMFPCLRLHYAILYYLITYLARQVTENLLLDSLLVAASDRKTNPESASKKFLLVA